jgi:GTP cyclohydrolase II
VSATAPTLRVYARARLPTPHGELSVVSFREPGGRKLDEVAVVVGDVASIPGVPTRIHSECLTGDVLGSYRCDCGDQLHLALERFAAAGLGVLLYMRQEGRGIGIAEKIRAYELQEGGLDTVEANEHLGYDTDLRSYATAAAMLHALGVESVELHTNNPAKVDGLTAHGIQVERRVAIVASPRDQNRGYLSTKRAKMGHILSLPGTGTGDGG